MTDFTYITATNLAQVVWLVDWLIDWLTGRLIDWLIDWLTDWLINDWLTDWLTDWLIDWLIGWLIGWLIRCNLPMQTPWINSMLSWKSSGEGSKSRVGWLHDLDQVLVERKGHAVLAIHNLSCPLVSLRNSMLMRQDFLFQAFGDFNCSSISHLVQVFTLLGSEEGRLPIRSFVVGRYPHPHQKMWGEQRSSKSQTFHRANSRTGGLLASGGPPLGCQSGAEQAPERRWQQARLAKGLPAPAAGDCDVKLRLCHWGCQCPRQWLPRKLFGMIHALPRNHQVRGSQVSPWK